MKLYTYIIVLAVFLLVAILFKKVDVIFEYNQSGYSYSLCFSTLWGIILYRYIYPKDWVTEGKRSEKHSNLLGGIKGARDTFEIIRRTARYLRYRLKIKKVDFNIVFGTGDSSSTAIFVGVAWAGVSIILSSLYHFVGIERKCISIKPDFQKKKLNIRLYCILTVRVAHIIIMVLMFFIGRIKKAISINNAKKNAPS
ncbi:MAG: DUF2953 domain-containing protein [Clostridium sp.]|nr:DUF2953 domain-containing protein [Clostridium sp.]